MGSRSPLETGPSSFYESALCIRRGGRLCESIAVHVTPTQRVHWGTVPCSDLELRHL